MKIAIKTLGCKANRAESDRVFESLIGRYDVFEVNEGASTFQALRGGSKSDILIVNTCTVTQAADRKSRQSIRSFKAKNPDCKVIVFGCGVNVSPESYKEMEEVDLLASNGEEVVEFAQKLAKEEGFESCEYEGAVTDLEHGFRTRALIKIQDGCNSFCSYCIIPTARGPELSVSSLDILKEVRAKEAAGFKEVVLTGINIGEWKEGDKEIGDLCEMLLKETGIPRFRVSSIEPKDFSDKFIGLFGEASAGRFCPQMHMSLQSGSNGVLYRMRRRYGVETYYDVCRRLREVAPDIGLTTDIIVGFPGETEEEFEETCKFVEDIGFLKVHVFPFSVRKGTAAYFMKDKVSDEVKKSRCERLREIAEKCGRKFKELCLGKEYEVLVENYGGEFVKGYTSNYIPVQINCTEGVDLRANDIVKVRLEEVLENGSVKAGLC